VRVPGLIAGLTVLLAARAQAKPVPTLDQVRDPQFVQRSSFR
jgi:hypothetical protein